MKRFRLIVVVLAAFSSTSWAQKGSGKMTSAPVAQPPKYSASHSSNKELKISLGMFASALHFGAQLEIPQGDGTALGGYIFNQSEKESAGVESLLALGGQYCIELLDSGKNKVYITPGFGFFKTKFNGEDETALGPSMRIGTSWKLANGGSLGLEKLNVFNWTSSKASSGASFYSAVYSFGF
jgi:hypothetical protein